MQTLLVRALAVLTGLAALAELIWGYGSTPVERAATRAV
jgi:hypothetical protein